MQSRWFLGYHMNSKEIIEVELSQKITGGAS
jgi:hypothetical protein